MRHQLTAQPQPPARLSVCLAATSSYRTHSQGGRLVLLSLSIWPSPVAPTPVLTCLRAYVPTCLRACACCAVGQGPECDRNSYEELGECAVLSLVNARTTKSRFPAVCMLGRFYRDKRRTDAAGKCRRVFCVLPFRFVSSRGQGGLRLPCHQGDYLLLQERVSSVHPWKARRRKHAVLFTVTC